MALQAGGCHRGTVTQAQAGTARLALEPRGQILDASHRRRFAVTGKGAGAAGPVANAPLAGPAPSSVQARRLSFSLTRSRRRSTGNKLTSH